MSIIAQSANSIPAIYVLLGVAITLGIPGALALGLRVHRPHAVLGPERLASDQSVVQLMAAVAMGVGSWALTPFIYLSMKGIHQTVASPAPKFSPADTAYLNTVPALAFVLTLLLADWAIGGVGLIRRLGLGGRKLPAGIALGILGAIIVVPPTFEINALCDQIYRAIHYVHPTEHPLLKVMHEPESRSVRIILILAATVVAPIAEEYVFRGHLQTILKRGIAAIWSRPPGATVEPRPPRALIAWLSILISAALFAMVHEVSSWPAIFFLAVGLGYCYERTGNLWASMTIHSLFNSTSTFLFLKYR